MNSLYYATPLFPGVDSSGNAITLASGAALYQELESGYNVQQWINGNGGQVPAVKASGWYGQPYLHQPGRTIRFTLRYTF